MALAAACTVGHRPPPVERRRGERATAAADPGEAGVLAEVQRYHAAQTVPAFVAKAPLGSGSKPIFEERMTGAVVRRHRNLAQVWAHYAAKFGDSSNLMQWQGIDAIVLMQHQGRWRIVALAFTDLNAGDR